MNAQQFDVCNGDADGLCAALQWRLHAGGAATLVTGLKRDIVLLERVNAVAGDQVNVFDIGMEANKAALTRLLRDGVHVRYVDHHECGQVPESPLLEVHIDLHSAACTSLLVDRLLGGEHRAWALVGIYGDNLLQVADALAEQTGLSGTQRQALRQLGEAINYNAYGDRVDEICMAPAGLFALMRHHADPWTFMAQEPVAEEMVAHRARDLDKALTWLPHWQDDRGAVFVLPDEVWSHRVSGTLANALANAYPERAHAVLTPHEAGNWRVSVRAPLNAPAGAIEACKSFGGSGRARAAGIDALPDGHLPAFIRHFAATRWGG